MPRIQRTRQEAEGQEEGEDWKLRVYARPSPCQISLPTASEMHRVSEIYNVGVSPTSALTKKTRLSVTILGGRALPVLATREARWRGTQCLESPPAEELADRTSYQQNYSGGFFGELL